MEWSFACLGLNELTARRVSDGAVVSRVPLPPREPERLQGNCVARSGGHVAISDEATNRLAFIDLWSEGLKWASLPPAYQSIERLSENGDFALVRCEEGGFVLVGPDLPTAVPVSHDVMAATVIDDGLLVAEFAGTSVTLRRAVLEGDTVRYEAPTLTATLEAGAEHLGYGLLGLEPWGPDRFVAQWPSPPDFQAPYLVVLEQDQQVRRIARTWFRAELAVVRDNTLVHFGLDKPHELLRMSLADGGLPAPVFEDSPRVLALAPDGTLAVCRGKSIMEDFRLTAVEYVVRDTDTGAVVSKVALPFQEAVLEWLVARPVS